MPKDSTKTLTMDELLAQSELKQLEAGDVVEGTITSVKKHEVWIDLGARGVGVVMRREIGHGQTWKKAPEVTVSVIDPEMDEGYALLSMKRAAKDRGWDELQRVFEAGEVIESAIRRQPRRSAGRARRYPWIPAGITAGCRPLPTRIRR
jgi:small subunit ribosomal protein S1